LETLEDRSLLSTSSAQLAFSTYQGGSDYDAASAVAVDASGNVYVTGSTTSSKDFPIRNAFQPVQGGPEDAFVAEYNPSGNRLWSTYLGGSGQEQGNGIAVDASGNVYVTGLTTSRDFPTTADALQPKLAGTQNAFVVKLTASGRLAYGTYLGGSSRDTGNGIAVDAAGDVYVTGVTFSKDFPTTAGVAQSQFGGSSDAFVTELDPTRGGGPVYSTYLGGNNSDAGTAIAVDPSGNAYITGQTSSHNFPTTASAFSSNFTGDTSAFVAKLGPGGTLAYSTYLGGGPAPMPGYPADGGSGIAADASGNAYITGQTFSSNFPTTAGAVQTSLAGPSDAFVTKLDTRQSGASGLVWSTYLGGDQAEAGSAIALDPAGNVSVTGNTASLNFPTTSGALQTQLAGRYNAFVAQLSVSGGLTFSTYLGGNGTDGGNGIAADAAGNIYVVGITDSPNFPTTPGAVQPTFGGVEDAFVSHLGLAASPGGGGGGGGSGVSSTGSPARTPSPFGETLRGERLEFFFALSQMYQAAFSVQMQALQVQSVLAAALASGTISSAQEASALLSLAQVTLAADAELLQVNAITMNLELALSSAQQNMQSLSQMLSSLRFNPAGLNQVTDALDQATASVNQVTSGLDQVLQSLN
jgi:hypothetical protein